MFLVTGGAGYIGSHCVMSLLEQGFDVICFDNLSTGHMETIKTLAAIGKDKFNFIQGDLLDFDNLDLVFRNNKIDTVIHFAAFSQVGESVKNPAKYYRNNVCGTLNLLDVMIKNDVRKIIFSSTAATYGEPVYTPIDEKHPQNPINPYGQTKLMIEKIMDDYDKAYGLKSVRLRYFNVAGADSQARIGEFHEPETHLIPNILKSEYEKTEPFKIFGTDYETKDGTCVRDYINMDDLIKAHILAAKYLDKGGETNFFNLGTTEGYSVKEVLETCQNVIGKEIPTKFFERREGDPAILVADNKKAKDVLNWQPNKGIEDSIKSAHKWHRKLYELVK